MIQMPFIAPKPYAYANYENVCQGNSVQFSNSSVASGGTLLSHYWDFGNGIRSNSGSDIVPYIDFGNFPIIYAVENSFGCKDTFKGNIEIYPRAVANFDYLPVEPEMMKDIYFNDLTQHSDLWEWDFGDGYFSTDVNPKHKYGNHGDYTVTLVANTNFNCSDTLVKQIRVKSTPLYWIPNVFTPGTTEDRNDSFGVFTPLKIHDYDLSVYNRWGQEVFRSNDPKIYWDGKVNNELALPGVYIYHVHFKSPENDIMTYKGSVLLLR
jgi:gliding motility-associated-like protein